MLVTRQGFEAAAVELEKSLETCAFAAIDCEMTGIMGDDSTRPLLSDTPGERYKKCAKVATRFQLMQVGVCPFHASEDGKSFTGTPFTFYVLPDAKANAPVHMLTSTVAFHAGCDFDFNAWLKGGIPYLSEAAYAGLAEKLARSDEPREGEKRERVVISSEADRAFFNAAISDLRAWLARCGDGGEAEFMLPECNAFLRRAFYEELEAAFPECVVESRMVADDPPPPPPPPPPTALSSEAPPAPPAPPSEAETAAETAKTAEAKPPTAEGELGANPLASPSAPTPPAQVQAQVPSTGGGGSGVGARTSGAPSGPPATAGSGQPSGHGRQRRRMVVLKLSDAQRAERTAAKRAAKLAGAPPPSPPMNPP